jgi:hypothetical protein
MNSVDYTPVILAQITDLQTRLTNQSYSIAILKGELERLTGKHINTTGDFTMKTSIPLNSKPYNNTNSRTRNNTDGSGHTRQPYPTSRPTHTTSRTNSKVTNTDRAPHPTMSLSDVLKNNEVVTVKIRLPNDTSATLVTVFDGTNLNVNTCDLVPSLVGFKTAKPGEILYKFMDELKNGGHITRTFSSPPWRLCFVERDGVTKSLEELRTVVG